MTSELNYTKLRTAIRAAPAGATVIATNPDVLTPVHDGYDPCVGVLTRRWQRPFRLRPRSWSANRIHS